MDLLLCLQNILFLIYKSQINSTALNIYEQKQQQIERLKMINGD